MICVLLPACTTTRFNEVDHNYSPGDEKFVTRAIISNGRARGKLTNKEAVTLSKSGPVYLNRLIIELNQENVDSEDFSIDWAASIVDEVIDLDSSLNIYLFDYKSIFIEINKQWDEIEKSYSDYLHSKIYKAIEVKDFKGAIEFAEINDQYVKEAIKIDACEQFVNDFNSRKLIDYQDVLYCINLIKNENKIGISLVHDAKRRAASLIESIPYSNREEALDKLSKIDSILGSFKKKEGEFVELRNQRKEIVESYVRRLYIAKSINKSEYSSKSFDTILDNAISNGITINAPYYTEINPFVDLVEKGMVEDGVFRDISHFLEAGVNKDIKKDNHLLLLTQVNSIKIQKEPKEIKTIRIEFDNPFTLRLHYNGALSHFEYTEEKQIVNTLLLVSYAIYDFAENRILSRDSVEHEKIYTSFQTKDLVVVAQDEYSSGGSRVGVGPIKKIPAGWRPL
jgi:hypothetical protein